MDSGISLKRPGFNAHRIVRSRLESGLTRQSLVLVNTVLAIAGAASEQLTEVYGTFTNGAD